jgi:hypothetical protein
LAVSKLTATTSRSSYQVRDPPASLQESIANVRAYASKIVKDAEPDAKRAAWRLLELVFPAEFFKLTGSPLPLALQTKPKTKWEIEREAKREREAISLLSAEERAQFAKDEAAIQSEKEAAKARRNELRSALKRKADAIEEAKVRLAEKDAKDRREQFERKRRRTDTPQSEVKCNAVALSVTPFVTPANTPILAGDLLHLLKAAIASGQFVVPGTASDPVTSEVLSLLTPKTAQPLPSASTSQAQPPIAAPSKPVASKKVAATSKEVPTTIPKVPALLSPISPKPTKGKALARPKSVAKPPAERKAAAEVRVVLERCDEKLAGVTPVKPPTTRRKSPFNPPTKELVEAAAKQSARRKSLRLAKESEPGKGDTSKPAPARLESSFNLNTLFGDSEEDELLKEVPPPIPTSNKEAVDEPRPRPVPRKTGLRIDSDSEPELQLAADEEAAPEAATAAPEAATAAPEAATAAPEAAPVQEQAVHQLVESAKNLGLADDQPKV